MAREKSQYNFTTNNPQATNDLIQSFLNSNGFELRQDGETQYYATGNSMTTIRSFEYLINGNQVVIYAYLGKPSHPMALTDGLVGALGIAPYKAQLQPLFDQLQAGVSVPPVSAAPGFAAPATTPTAQPQFKSGTDKYATIAFVFALLGLVLAAFGTFYGVVPILITFILASTALHSNKRNLAIAAIVMSSISLLVLVVWVILLATGVIVIR